MPQTPDPLVVRAATLTELTHLGLPTPPENYPLVWEPGDQVELRPTLSLERRVVILHVVLARLFGMPAEAAVAWLEENDLPPDVTDPEWAWITEEIGDRRSFALHLDAIAGLAWVLGLISTLDPFAAPPRLMELLPDLTSREPESFAAWRARTLPAPRPSETVAAVLDLHYCLDWAVQRVEQGPPGTPSRLGLIGSDAIGQRRWALEWAVVFTGPYHGPPGGWEEVDLST